MRRGWTVLFLIAGCASGALASGYDDYNRAVTDNIRGDHAAAIAAFTAALATNDLPKPYVGAAHLGRANAYLQLDRCADALPDLDASLALEPNNVEALVRRQWTDLCLNKPDDAKADFNRAFPQPTAYDHLAFGMLNWRYDFFRQAAGEFLTTFDAIDKRDTSRAFLLLCYAMSALRAGTFDQSAYAARRQQFDSSDWPAPLFDFYAGKLTIAELDAQAESINPKRAESRKCDVDFYVAEWNLAHNIGTDVAARLKAASAECPDDGYESQLAGIELMRQSKSKAAGGTP